MSGKYQLVTLGCKVNQYESQQVREVLQSLGLDPVQRGQDADIAVVNTCAVTATATRKSRQAVRRISRGGRTPVIIIGCGASADTGRLRGIPHVIAVLGHDVDVCAEIRRLVADLLLTRSTDPRNHPPGQPASPGAPGSTTWLCQSENTQTREQAGFASPDDDGNEISMSPVEAQLREGVSSSALFRSPDKIVPLALANVNPGSDSATERVAGFDARIQSFEGRQRAFLKIQDGCDAFCTYCIIPRLRPQLRSKPIEAAVAEVRGLVEAGFKEIILTGIFLGAYGRETAIRKRWPASPQGRPEKKSPLADLVRALAGVDGLARLRISSLEPGDVDEALLAVLAEHENCVPHLHLPLQSGSGRILSRMNRQYGANAYVEMIDRVREALDRPAISTDIIVGFPGETEAEFAETLGIARYAGFSKIHAFPFSPREQTAAFRWIKDFIPAEIARDRMTRLADLERELSLAFRKQFVGEVERVIVEGKTGEDGSAGDAAAGSGSGEPRTPAPAPIHHGRSDRHFEIFYTKANDSCILKTLSETDADPSMEFEEGERIGWSHEVFPSPRTAKFNEMEFSVPFADGPDTLREIREVILAHDEVGWPIEYRTVKGDDCLISPHTGRDSVAISVHQSYRREHGPFFRDCQAVFLNHGGRPHWGKMQFMAHRELSALYPQWDAFQRVRDRL
ncbi:MAG: MiaB/RimO family radical SAM methylthiotransferase, partial [Planctomycetes bacterium]|nr:MiaB/RimO family radical SAM methylthiotransferase [Planctomycetota bacterium]